MNVAVEIELRALLEKLSPGELVQVAAMLVERWSETKGDISDSDSEFFAAAMRMRKDLNRQVRSDVWGSG